MTRYSLVLSTCPSDAAERIALALLEEKLCACVNIVPHVLSLYHWSDKIERSSESLLLMKTEENRKEDLLDALRRVHPYEVPEFVVIPIEWGSKSYLKWISESTSSGASP
jgi:periplasmic divalent cation tolerance protein